MSSNKKPKVACNEAEQAQDHQISNHQEGQRVAKESENESSQVVRFYDSRCVLVTGASGFLGKLIIEKLLRTCTGIKKIFVLIRPKRSKTARERLNELFESPIFDSLKSSSTRRTNKSDDDDEQSFDLLRGKVVLLQGELTQPFLGLSIERLLQLADECSVILHSAAVVSFGGQPRRSIEANVGGTYNVLQLASKLPKLQALVHVSTSYSNCTRHRIGEHIYPVNMDPKSLLEIIDDLDDGVLETLAKHLKGKHPNYYTYTKQLAEFLCAQFATSPHQLPIVICRPSVIVPTLAEPMKAFVDNRNAGNGVFDGVARGLIRSINGSSSVIFDCIPADFVTNCVISLGWFCDLYHRVRVRLESPREINSSDNLVRIDDKKMEKRVFDYYAARKKSLRLASIKLSLDENLIQIPVFHVTSGAENTKSLQEMLNFIAKYSLEFPSMELVRKPGCSIIENSTLHYINTFFGHTLVGKLLDLTRRVPKQQAVGKRSPNWSHEFQRINKFNNLLVYFYSNTFQFYPDNRLKLIEEFMNKKDRQLFNCDVRQVDWDEFARDMTLGFRKYLNGEPESTLPKARARLTTILWRNSLLQLIFITLISYLILTLIGY